MPKARIFRHTCAAFIIGIGLASYFPFNIWILSTVLIFSAAAIFLPFKAKFKLIAVIAVFFCLGAWRAGSCRTAGPDDIDFYNGRTLVLTGRIENEPVRGERSLQSVLQASSAENAGEVGGKVLVISGLFPEYAYGDVLQLECRLEKPEPLDDFAYDRYLARKGIYSVCFYPENAVIITRDHNQLLRQKAFSLVLHTKGRIRSTIDRGLPEKEAALARAVLLGDKKALPESDKENFSLSGLSHLTAISGMHIGIFIFLVTHFLFLSGFSRQQIFSIALPVLFVYIVLVGFPASAVRAGLMGVFILWAMRIGRLSKPANSLLFAACLILAFNPRMLRDDIGFQLSFLAVSGILAFYGPLDGFFRKLTKGKFAAMTSVLNITVCSQIFSLPVLVYNFSIFTALSVFSNLAVLWIMPLLMAVLIGAILASYILPPAGVLFFVPPYLALKYVLAVAGFFSGISLGIFDMENFPTWVLAVYAAAALFAAWSVNRRKPVGILTAV